MKNCFWQLLEISYFLRRVLWCCCYCYCCWSICIERLSYRQPDGPRLIFRHETLKTQFGNAFAKRHFVGAKLFNQTSFNHGGQKMGFGAGDICTRLQILSLFFARSLVWMLFWLPSPPFCLKSTKTSLGKVQRWRVVK